MLAAVARRLREPVVKVSLAAPADVGQRTGLFKKHDIDLEDAETLRINQQVSVSIALDEPGPGSLAVQSKFSFALQRTGRPRSSQRR